MISFYFALVWAQALSPLLVAATESEITSEQKYFQAQLGGLVAEKFVAEFDEASTNKVNADALVRKDRFDGDPPGGPAAAQNDGRNDEGAADNLADDAAKTPDDDAAKTPDDDAKTPIGDPPQAGAEGASAEAGGAPYAEVTTKITALNEIFTAYGTAHKSLEASAGESQKAANQYKKELEELAKMWTQWQQQAAAVEKAIEVLNKEADRNKAGTFSPKDVGAAEAAPAEDSKDAENQPEVKITSGVSMLETQRGQPDYETEQSLQAIKRKIDEAKREKENLSSTLGRQKKAGQEATAAAKTAEEALKATNEKTLTNNTAPPPKAPAPAAADDNNSEKKLDQAAELVQLSS